MPPLDFVSLTPSDRLGPILTMPKEKVFVVGFLHVIFASFSYCCRVASLAVWLDQLVTDLMQILLMGTYGSGKTSMRSIIFANYLGVFHMCAYTCKSLQAPI